MRKPTDVPTLKVARNWLNTVRILTICDLHFVDNYQPTYTIIKTAKPQFHFRLKNKNWRKFIKILIVPLAIK